MNFSIEGVAAAQSPDARAHPPIAVDLRSHNGHVARSAVYTGKQAFATTRK